MSDIITIASSMGGRPAGMLAGSNRFLTSAAAGTVISALLDPFAGMGLGTTTYSTIDTVPSALALSGTNIVVGASVMQRSHRYPITIQAVSGNSQYRAAETITFQATLG